MKLIISISNLNHSLKKSFGNKYLSKQSHLSDLIFELLILLPFYLKIIFGQRNLFIYLF